MQHNASLTTPYSIRMMIRNEDYTGKTSGFVPGMIQANLIVLPQQYALEFLQFCQANRQSCPVLASSKVAGATDLPEHVAFDLDLRSDLSGYRVFKHGQLFNEVANVKDIWRDDYISFALASSLSFEESIRNAGIEVRNITELKNAPMYLTNIPCEAVGKFASNLVVSMRPMKPADAIRAIQICCRYPDMHGVPIHFGNPADIGIKNINRPTFGDPVTIKEGEVPVFWASSATAEVAMMNARIDSTITQRPGHMLITDIKNSDVSLF
ncbi:putative hydro-lyase [Pseudoalteromonas sp. MMG010]|uniref:putative hydro-lyase n=1 Tax=Pseudoalteromonas sp. MMG010 TaxID=2822685 RepID=UPI001B3A14EC|nr:putative hydro-lyase [Pseudoalteromonas sp. MMG010]MBQ4833653.1 putative hydro-lyase [Pseudoalteromonas sp. MMG010]